MCLHICTSIERYLQKCVVETHTCVFKVFTKTYSPKVAFKADSGENSPKHKHNIHN